MQKHFFFSLPEVKMFELKINNEKINHYAPISQA